jgi:hypothetical protein
MIDRIRDGIDNEPSITMSIKIFRERLRGVNRNNSYKVFAAYNLLCTLKRSILQQQYVHICRRF